MILLFAFLILTALAAIFLITVLILSVLRVISAIRKKTNPKQTARLKKAALLFAAAIILNAGLVTVSQLTATTPKIAGENSIAELTRVELNGRKQWISIRGVDKDKPVLLFLAGGPGGSQLAAVRYELAELEKHFVVVGWDQPGAAKSYYAETIKNLTPDTYVQDGYALTQYLIERFGEEKIYLIGESWGSALGIFLVDRYPECYHALIGTGQMVDFTETERFNYEKALEIAAEKNDDKILKTLQKNGVPPYYGKDMTLKCAVYMNYLSAFMSRDPAISNAGYDTPRDLAACEYGLLDKVNYARGILNTYNQVYQQLYGIDMRRDYARLDVPVYFFIGRRDVNAPPALAEEYFEVLEAPEKKLVWFEHSGHSPWINERELFAKEVLTCLGQQ